MPNGRPSRRTLPRIVRGLPLLIACVFSAAGCQRLNVRPADLALGANSDDGPKGMAKPTPPVELPELPAQVLAPTEVEPSEPTPANLPTPLLDAAIARTQLGPETAVATTGDTPAETLEFPGPSVEGPVPTSSTGPEETTSPPSVRVSETASTVLTSTRDDLPPTQSEKSIDPERPSALTASRVSWPEGLDRLRELARRQAGGSGEDGETWTIRAHVLDWLAGEPTAANDPSGRAWSSVLTALATVSADGTSGPSELAHRLREGVSALEALAPLEVNNLHLCRKVHKFGLYESVDSDAVRIGQTYLVYWELDGVTYQPTGDAMHSRVASRIALVKVDGGATVWSETLPAAEDICLRRRRDYYLNYRIAIPATITQGAYVLRVTENDELSGRSTTAELPLSISP